MLKISKKISTDVLVIGGGGAACTAAVAAARNGARVALVSKGRIGNSGNTIMIGGSYGMDGESAFYDYQIEEADPSFTRDALFRSIVNDGFYLSDQNMVEQFVEESPHIVNEVRRWGEQAGQFFQFYRPSMWNVSGRGLGKSLQKGLDHTDRIERFEDVYVIELLKNGDRVTGALALDICSGELIEFEAKAAILGTGGFQPFSLKNTNSDMTGDGQAMAYRAGAKLADMEFMMFLVTALEPNEMKGSILPVIMLFRKAFGYDPLDGNGEKIEVPQKLRDLEKTSEMCKLVHIYYYGKAISAGRGTADGGIYFDFTRFSDEEIDGMFEEVMNHFDGFYKRGFYHGDNIMEYKRIIKEKRKIEVGLSNEYCVGGILVDETMYTGVEGLYAAGECASGVFGANRVADAVTEMMCQGYKAGSVASGYAAGTEILQSDTAYTEKQLRVLERILSQREGMRASDARKRLEEISDRTIGFYREEAALKRGVKEYEELESALLKAGTRSSSLVYNLEFLRLIQVKNCLICAKIAAKMALNRRESRGLHLRSDYPYIDNEQYLTRTIAKRMNGEDILTSRPPVVTRMPLKPAGKLDYETYLQEEDLGMSNMEER